MKIEKRVIIETTQLIFVYDVFEDNSMEVSSWKKEDGAEFITTKEADAGPKGVLEIVMSDEILLYSGEP